MSHGPAGGETVDPNLTPLLDLVLQLLMLFMICGNYASESNDPVDLARSSTAKQLADTEGTTQPEGDFLFVTVKPYRNADGVKAAALDELAVREKQGAYTAELVAHKRKLVDDLYQKLLNKDNINDEERSLLIELNIPVNSEQDLADHMQETVRKNLLGTFKDGDSYVIVPGEDAMKPDDNLLLWLQKRYKALSDKANGGEVKTAVVIRPDGNMDYAVVYRILKLCKDAHFTNLKVRALIQKGIDT
jgi:biopolymer transport protein ExbD